jgi:hypothetical protein
MTHINIDVPDLQVVISPQANIQSVVRYPTTTRVYDAPFTIFAETSVSASYAAFALSASYVMPGVTVTSASFAVQADLGDYGINRIPLWGNERYLTSSIIAQNSSGRGIFIGRDYQSYINQYNEVLGVYAGLTDSTTIAYFSGTINDVLKINVRNSSTGSSGSSDVVATSDGGRFVDFGINGSGYSGLRGGSEDAYVYVSGSNMFVGSITPNKSLFLFVGGTNFAQNTKLLLSYNNQHLMTGSLDISGSLVVNNGVSASLHGTSSVALQVPVYSGNLGVGETTYVGTFIGRHIETMSISPTVTNSTSSFDYNSGSVFYIQNITGTGAWNVINVPTDTQRVTEVKFIIPQGVTPYSSSLYQVNGTSVSMKWKDSIVPTGNANKTDVITVQLINSGSTFTALGTLTTFG